MPMPLSNATFMALFTSKTRCLLAAGSCVLSSFLLLSLQNLQGLCMQQMLQINAQH